MLLCVGSCAKEKNNFFYWDHIACIKPIELKDEVIEVMKRENMEKIARFNTLFSCEMMDYRRQFDKWGMREKLKIY